MEGKESSKFDPDFFIVNIAHGVPSNKKGQNIIKTYDFPVAFNSPKGIVTSKMVKEYFQKYKNTDPNVKCANLNFFIYNLKFSLTEEFNKIILLINNQTRIEVGLYNKNMDDKWKNERNLEAKKSMDKLKEKMNSLLNIVSMQKNKIAELKQKEESQVKLINKIEEVTNKINEQYQQQVQNNNNMPQNNNNNINNNMNNNYPNNYNNDKRKNLFMTTNPNLQGNYPVANDLNSMNMNNKKNPKLNMTVNVKFKPYLPENTNVNNLLTRPQYANPYPQNQPTHMKLKSINLDNIPDYRRSNSNY